MVEGHRGWGVRLIELVALSLTAVAAVASVIGAAFAYHSHRARLRSELPNIQIGGWTFETPCRPFSSLIYFWFEVGVDHNSVGWEVIRVEANKSRGSRCLLASVKGEPEWRDSYDLGYPTNKGRIRIEETRGSGWLTFTCQHASRKEGRYKKKKVAVPYVVWEESYSVEPKLQDHT